MANAYVEKTLGDGSILFYDNAGAGGANTLDEDAFLPVGNFSASIPAHIVDQVNGGVSLFGEKVDLFRRGRYVRSRVSTQAPITGSFECHVANFTGDATTTDQTPLDLSMWLPGGATSIDAWTPTNGTNTEVAQWGMRFRMEGTAHGDSKDHDLVFTQVEIENIDFSEAEEGNKITVNWRAWGMAKA